MYLAVATGRASATRNSRQNTYIGLKLVVVSVDFSGRHVVLRGLVVIVTSPVASSWWIGRSSMGFSSHNIGLVHKHNIINEL